MVSWLGRELFSNLPNIYHGLISQMEFLEDFVQLLQSLRGCKKQVDSYEAQKFQGEGKHARHTTL